MNRPSGLFRTTSFRECVCLHRVSAMIKLRDDDPARPSLGCSSRGENDRAKFSTGVDKGWYGVSWFRPLCIPAEPR